VHYVFFQAPVELYVLYSFRTYNCIYPIHRSFLMKIYPIICRRLNKSIHINTYPRFNENYGINDDFQQLAIHVYPKNAACCTFCTAIPTPVKTTTACQWKITDRFPTETAEVVCRQLTTLVSSAAHFIHNTTDFLKRHSATACRLVSWSGDETLVSKIRIVVSQMSRCRHCARSAAFFGTASNMIFVSSTQRHLLSSLWPSI
jgi:hypothetical protein